MVEAFTFDQESTIISRTGLGKYCYKKTTITEIYSHNDTTKCYRITNAFKKKKGQLGLITFQH